MFLLSSTKIAHENRSNQKKQTLGKPRIRKQNQLKLKPIVNKEEQEFFFETNLNCSATHGVHLPCRSLATPQPVDRGGLWERGKRGQQGMEGGRAVWGADWRTVPPRSIAGGPPPLSLSAQFRRRLVESSAHERPTR